MISSLPKPVQNDVDTIIIDLLSRYSLDNKNLRQFVQTVSQQVRGLNKSIPRILKAATKSTNTDKNQLNQKAEDDSGKPNFLTRLDNLQTSFNKGGLLGVIFEHLKNKQPEADTINAVSVSEKDKTANESNQQPDKTTDESKTGFLEKISSKFEKLEKLQEVYDKRGLIGVTQNIFNQFKKKAESEKEKQEPSQNLTTTYNNSSKINNTAVTPTTNFATESNTASQVNSDITNVDKTNEPFETEQAQTQNLLSDEVVVLIGGVNEYGRKDLSDIIKTALNEVFNEQQKLKGGLFAGIRRAGEESNSGSEGGSGEGIIDLLADIALIKQGAGGAAGATRGILGKILSKGKGLFGKAAGGAASLFGKGGVTAAATKTAGAGAGTAGAAATGATVLGGLAIGGTIGTGLAKNETFSEFMYGDKDAGKKAMEEYDTGFLGLMAIPQLFRASYDATKAIGEAKEARQRLDEMEKQTIPLDIKAMMFGYKDLADFAKAKGTGKEKRGMFWDKQKQSVIIIHPDKSTEIHKFIYGKGFQGKPEIISPDGKIIKKEKSKEEKSIKQAAENPVTTVTETTSKENLITAKTEPVTKPSETKQDTITPENITQPQPTKIEQPIESNKAESTTLTPENITQPQPTKIEQPIESNKAESTTLTPENTNTVPNIYVPKDLSKTEINKWTESVKEYLKNSHEQKTKITVRGVDKLNDSKLNDTLLTTKLKDSTLLDSTAQYPEANPLIDKNFKPVQPLEYKSEPVKPFKFDIPDTSSILATGASATKEKDITPLTPDVTEIPTSTSPNITENHITNNNADKDLLSNIAGNTEKTSKSINSLSEAVFALAKVFDNKSGGGNNNIVVNSGQQTQQFTSTSQIAAANKDAIRGIRRQFLHVMS